MPTQIVAKKGRPRTSQVIILFHYQIPKIIGFNLISNSAISIRVMYSRKIGEGKKKPKKNQHM